MVESVINVSYAAAKKGGKTFSRILLNWGEKQTAEPMIQPLNEERGNVYPVIRVGNHQIYVVRWNILTLY
jgi:hypothetical protein